MNMLGIADDKISGNSTMDDKNKKNWCKYANINFINADGVSVFSSKFNNLDLD